MPAPPPGQEWRPSHSPWLVALSVMLSVFMQLLDTSVANVSIPHIAGGLSASVEETTWVLTSYLVSSAIVLAASGWLSAYFGRKRYMGFSVLLFTASSAACGFAHTLPELIIARILQGIGGGGLLPLSQAVLLESFPYEQRGTAMSAYGMGVVVAPIIGPILGGWITDDFSWRWIFFINVPIGAAGFLLQQLFLEDPPYLKRARGGKIDYVGLLLMSAAIGVFQIVVDKGQEEDWFNSAWIARGAVLAALAFPAFALWELRTKDPFMDLKLLRDRNLAAGSAQAAVLGAVLYSATAMLPVFMQTLLGYSATESGLSMMPRGIGTFLTVMFIGRLMRVIPEKLLMIAGFLIVAVSCWELGKLNLDVTARNIAVTLFFNGMGLGLIFVPLTTLSMSGLKPADINQGSGIFNLLRNLGASASISLIFALQTRLAQAHQNIMAGHLSVYDQQFREWLLRAGGLFPSMPDFQTGLLLPALGYARLLKQSSLLAFMDSFRLISVLGIFSCLLTLLFRTPAKKKPSAGAEGESEPAGGPPEAA